MAELELELGRPEEARTWAERAVALRAPTSIPPRYRAQAQLVLARALWDAPVGKGRDRERAIEIVRETQAALGGIPYLDREREALDAWLDGRSRASSGQP